MGKVRLKTHPFQNHWWHVTLYVSPRGLTTRAIPYSGSHFEIEMDLSTCEIVVRHGNGKHTVVPITGRSISDVYAGIMDALYSSGVDAKIYPIPYDCKSTVPFDSDVIHRNCDFGAVLKAWKALAAAEGIFEEFRSRFIGKCSPVHMFWHSFDLAVTRFSGRAAPSIPQANYQTQEAYSHEVNSAGFWFGDDTFQEAAFYCYTAPSPAGLAEQPLAPAEAFWKELRGAPMALYRYEDWMRSSRPREDLLGFLQSSYEAGANTAKWDRANLERV